MVKKTLKKKSVKTKKKTVKTKKNSKTKKKVKNVIYFKSDYVFKEPNTIVGKPVLKFRYGPVANTTAVEWYNIKQTSNVNLPFTMFFWNWAKNFNENSKKWFY